MTGINHAGGTTGATMPPHVNAFLDAYAAQPAMVATPAGGDLLDMTDAIGRMRIEETPFTYGIIDDFLPKEVYETVLRDWPTPSAFGRVEMPKAPGATEIGSRRVLLIQDTSAPDHDVATGVWNQVAEALRAPSFVRGLFARFSEVIDANLTGVGGVAEKKPAFRLYQCFDQGAKDALKAHVDAPWKLLTIVIYLDLRGAVNEDSEQLWGTALYDAEGGTVTALQFTPNADHKLAGRVGFVPNRAFVMPNSSRALHGVAGGQLEVQRRTLMCGYRLGDL